MVEVAIVGAGLMGSAMAFPLSDNGHTVWLIGTHLDDEIIRTCREKRYHPRLRRALPENVLPCFSEEIPRVVPHVQVIVSGVSSYGVHWVGRAIAPYVRPGQKIIAVTKGLEATEDGDLCILPDVLAGELPEDVRDRIRIAAIGGPCIAGELAGRRQSCVVFGARDPETVESLAQTFRTSYYHVWTTTDVVGLEMAAALKNAYTLGVGLAAGLLEGIADDDASDAQMHNLAAAVFAQACVEIEYILRTFAAPRSFSYALPGAGDLYVTCQGGRTMRLGRLLGMGYSLVEAQELMAGETLESVAILQVLGRALPRLEARGVLEGDRLPLLRALTDTVCQGQPVVLPLDQFFQTVPELQNSQSVRCRSR